MVSAIDEEDLFIDNLKTELRQLEDAEAASLEKAGDEIISALEGSREEKLVVAKRELDSSDRNLAQRWEAAEKTKESLESQNRARDAQIDGLKKELALLRSAKNEEKNRFSKNVASLLDKVAAAADERQKISRKESAKQVANTILAYSKSPKSQAPMSELLPIDRSVSRIYQKMSFLMEGND